MRPSFLITLALILSTFAGFFSEANGADLPLGVANEINGLNIEIGEVLGAEKTLFAEQASLKKEEQRLIATKELLDGAAKNLVSQIDAWQNKQRAHNAEATRQQAEAARHDAAISAHNSRCAGTFKDQSYVNACNAAAAMLNAYTNNTINPWRDRVNASRDQINDQRKTLEMKRNGLNERFSDLQKSVTDWAKRKKENNYQINELQAREQALRAKLHEILNSPAVKDLMKRNEISQECKAIAQKITPGDAVNPNLSTPMERAQRCLQRIWDGAK